MFLPTKENVKLANGNTEHTQGIGIILCCFTDCLIIYTVGPVYFFSGHSYNAISSDFLKLYVGFQKVPSEPIENCDFVDPQDQSWTSH